MFPHKVSVVLDEMTYECVETAYMAARIADKTERVRIQKMSPYEAKDLSERGLLPRPSNWDEIKVPLMTSLVRQKFENFAELSKLLLETGNQELIEGNDWGDTFWGICGGVGENHLGKILMQIRGEIQKAKMTRD